MTNWTQNLILYERTGNTGNCPVCNSENIEVVVTEYGRKSISFLCKECKSGDHFDGQIEIGSK